MMNWTRELIRFGESTKSTSSQKVFVGPNTYSSRLLQVSQNWLHLAVSMSIYSTLTALTGGKSFCDFKPSSHVASNLLAIKLRLDVQIACDGLQQKL